MHCIISKLLTDTKVLLIRIYSTGDAVTSNNTSIDTVTVNIETLNFIPPGQNVELVLML